MKLDLFGQKECSGDFAYVKKGYSNKINNFL